MKAKIEVELEVPDTHNGIPTTIFDVKDFIKRRIEMEGSLIRVTSITSKKVIKDGK